MKLAIRFIYISLFFILTGIEDGLGQPSEKNSVISLSDELRTLNDISLLPAYLDNSVVAQTSTYDITGGNEDGFSGKYSFIRRNPDSSLVIFDMQGPGVITRIWTPTPTEDSFDFIIDGKKILSIKYDDLFSGKVFPFVNPLCGQQLGGSYCYFPILFQKNCLIVCRGKKMQFHQIQYKLYPAGTRVKSFNSILDSMEKTNLENVISSWSSLPGIWETFALFLPVSCLQRMARWK